LIGDICHDSALNEDTSGLDITSRRGGSLVLHEKLECGLRHSSLSGLGNDLSHSSDGTSKNGFKGGKDILTTGKKECGPEETLDKGHGTLISGELSNTEVSALQRLGCASLLNIISLVILNDTSSSFGKVRGKKLRKLVDFRGVGGPVLLHGSNNLIQFVGLLYGEYSLERSLGKQSTLRNTRELGRLAAGDSLCSGDMVDERSSNNTDELTDVVNE
jgi:hypothetical protein